MKKEITLVIKREKTMTPYRKKIFIVKALGVEIDEEAKNTHTRMAKRE